MNKNEYFVNIFYLLFEDKFKSIKNNVNIKCSIPWWETQEKVDRYAYKSETEFNKKIFYVSVRKYFMCQGYAFSEQDDKATMIFNLENTY